MRWSLFQEQGKWVIRRWYNGKYQRLPVKKYARIRDSYPDLEEFVKRLNAPIDTKEKVDFKHAFINEKLLDEYLEYLVTQIPTERSAHAEFTYLKRYALNYFIRQLDLMNPLDWHRVHETKWAQFLCSDKAPASAKSKRAIVQALNRFMNWLHKRRPSEVPALVFTPISTAKFKQIEAQRQLDGDVKERKFIADAHWQIISQALKNNVIEPHCLLAFHYGVRRSESLGAAPAYVKKGYLSVERQLASLPSEPVFKPLKGRDVRKVPHWFSTAAQAYQWCERAQQSLMHPDTLTDRWNELMTALQLSYDFHDLRHSFITRAIRVHSARDVQLAAGHVNIQTTMRYAHDDRNSDDDQFIPEAG